MAAQAFNACPWEAFVKHRKSCYDSLALFSLRETQCSDKCFPFCKGMDTLRTNLNSVAICVFFLDDSEPMQYRTVHKMSRWESVYYCGLILTGEILTGKLSHNRKAWLPSLREVSRSDFA